MVILGQKRHSGIHWFLSSACFPWWLHAGGWWVLWLHRISLLQFRWEMVLPWRLVEKFFPGIFGIFWNSSILGVFDGITPIGDNWFCWSCLYFSKLNDFCISWEMSVVCLKECQDEMSVSWMVASSLHHTNGATVSLAQLNADLLNTHRMLL